MNIKEIIFSIDRGELIDPDILLPYLCFESKKERYHINFELAKVYSRIKNYNQAKVFIQRAWLLSNFSLKVLPVYIEIFSQLNDIDAIQKAYKQIGMKKASQHRIIAALKYFQLSFISQAKYKQKDLYQYDFDILQKVRWLASFYKIKKESVINSERKNKIRLAYLVFGITSEGSVVSMINNIFSHYHDKSKFEVAYFIPEMKREIMFSNAAKISILKLKKNGCKVFIPSSLSKKNSLIEVANNIYSFQADILITNALLADIKNYFIVSLNPAPVKISFVLANPAQFISPEIDWGITFSKNLKMDCPCNCSHVKLEINLPEKKNKLSLCKSNLNIKDDAIIITIAGRYTKLQDVEFVLTLLKVIKKYDNVYCFVIGANKDELPFWTKNIDSILEKKIIFWGWIENYIDVFELSDILIDTYPSGGGVILLDAMSLGIPVVSFKNNYMNLSDQNNWSLGDEYINVNELLIDRGDFNKLTKTLYELIENHKYRVKMGEKCKELVLQENSQPQRMVKSCEDIYELVLRKKNKKVWNPFIDRDFSEIQLVENTQTFIKKIFNFFNKYFKSFFRVKL